MNITLNGEKVTLRGAEVRVGREAPDFVLVDNGLTTKDFAGFIRYNDPKTNEEKYALRYEEFIALNTHMIQKLYKRIEELEKKLLAK